MHVRQPLQYPRRKELSRALWQPTVHIPALNQIQQLPSLHELQQHVNTRLVLEGVDELAHKGMVQLGHDRAFALRPAGLSLIQQLALALDLERVRHVPAEGAYDPNPPEGPGAKQSVEFQIVEGLHRLVRLPLLPPSFVVFLSTASQPMQVLDNAVDVREGEPSQDDLVGDDVDRLVAVLVPALGATEPHVLVRGECVLAEEAPDLYDAIELGVLLGDGLDRPAADDVERRLVDAVSLDEDFLVDSVDDVFDEGRQEFVFEILKVRVPQERHASQEATIAGEEDGIL
mmetsp:Transcript_26115/g.47384  ORF Transcript_26115/g.47384 Transcript_26115/m.47384 type:complete len:287 (-) Transcript_26115:312-1172(-)